MRHTNSNARFRSTAALGVLPVCLWLSHAACAQWSIVNMHPPGVGGESLCRDVTNGRQVGWARPNAPFGRAGFWSSTAGSWIDLNPAQAGFTGSLAFGMDESYQVGYTDIGGRHHASLWNGTAASWIDLHPPGSTDSLAYGVSSGQQVGESNPGGGNGHAFLWFGTAASWVDLNPAGSTMSNAYGSDGTYQVGSAVIGGVRRAGMWTGSAASWVNLHPAGAGESWGLRVRNGKQIGVAVVNGAQHASLWRGTAQSWVDLNPAGSTSSWAWGLFGGMQVGEAVFAGAQRASLWTGSPDSWVDLHAQLPANFSRSVAHGIWSDPGHVYIAGYGFNTSTGRNEALMWVRPVTCEPDFTGDGNTDQDDVVYLINLIAGGENPSARDADFNHDGCTDQDDVVALINAIAGAECP